jgi:hypothetical protein
MNELLRAIRRVWHALCALALAASSLGFGAAVAAAPRKKLRNTTNNPLLPDANHRLAPGAAASIGGDRRRRGFERNHGFYGLHQFIARH